MKTYDLKFYGDKYKIAPVKQNYENGRLAVELYEAKDGEVVDCFDVITVNLPNEMVRHPNNAFIDTNNSPYATKFLEKNGIAKPTGFMGISGYCVYPEYHFDIEKLNAELE